MEAAAGHIRIQREETADGVFAAVELNSEAVPEPGADQPFAETAEPAFEEAGPPADTEALDCVIEPSEVIDVRSTVEGRIHEIHVERSDVVEAGQVVAELDSAVELAAAEVARTRAGMTGNILAREANVELSSRRRDRTQRSQAAQQTIKMETNMTGPQSGRPFEHDIVVLLVDDQPMIGEAVRRRGDSSEGSVGGWPGPVARVSSHSTPAQTSQLMPAVTSEVSRSPRTPDK